MSTPLFIFPMLLFMLAMLALVSGIGVIYILRNKRAGHFTTFIWIIFSASISMGFMTFGMFVYVTQHNDVLAIGISVIGMLAVLGAGWLATL